jgi:hypothetical protein
VCFQRDLKFAGTERSVAKRAPVEEPDGGAAEFDRMQGKSRAFQTLRRR